MQIIPEASAVRQLRVLAHCKSLASVLMIALGFEEATCRFYALLAQRVREEIGPLVGAIITGIAGREMARGADSASPAGHPP